MIAARQIAFGGSKRKPYDAEIEYLESTGTQWIDTGVIPDNETGLSLIADKPVDAIDVYIAGMRNNLSDTRWCIGWSKNSNWYSGWGTVGVASNSLDVVKVSLHLNLLNDRKFNINGGTNSSLSTLKFTPQYNIRLFGSAGVVANYTSAKVKIYKAQITQGDALVFDATPVRVGDVGYMYDKVSGKLFGNAGTGAFVLGSDLIDYTAKDYIQDGLVALVDGVENAGWGKHTDELKYVNLVTGEQFDLPNNGNAVWGADCLKVLESGNRTSGLQTGFVFSASTLGITSDAKSYTIECALRAYDSNVAVVSFSGAFGRTLGTPSSESFKGVVSSAYYPDVNQHRWTVNGENRYKTNAGVTQENFEGFFWNNREAYAGQNFSFGCTYATVCKSDIHCARIYNRALTAEEIAYNYEIDKARFNI